MKLAMTALAIALLVSVNVQANEIKLEVNATAYCEKQHRTASGEKVNHKTIAVSRDIKQKYNLKWGQRVWVSVLNEHRIIQDLMAKRIKNTFDIWFPSEITCRKWGKRTVTVTLVVR